ncbi:hypothetical protein CO179_05230 [candidate division WWE3 bacterium CG_4_9_14_3_um_filter_39_7]|uniref:Uncharacterized protein n=1 Tax=candidate division WWE3 bacterium CG_4_9_14_3_um_filter_39_7 TaxID=1975080 RepID=A0A2M7X069_UNCKA|nr:MAG: hypothetical protein CO179_05230 [candidate division WWE3 bacterium CG_4_9_14_3_um_filter_39_7]
MSFGPLINIVAVELIYLACKFLVHKKILPKNMLLVVPISFSILFTSIAIQGSFFGAGFDVQGLFEIQLYVLGTAINIGTILWRISRQEIK